MLPKRFASCSFSLTTHCVGYVSMSAFFSFWFYDATSLFRFLWTFSFAGVLAGLLSLLHSRINHGKHFGGQRSPLLLLSSVSLLCLFSSSSSLSLLSLPFFSFFLLVLLYLLPSCLLLSCLLLSCLLSPVCSYPLSWTISLSCHLSSFPLICWKWVLATAACGRDLNAKVIEFQACNTVDWSRDSVSLSFPYLILWRCFIWFLVADWNDGLLQRVSKTCFSLLLAER